MLLVFAFLLTRTNVGFLGWAYVADSGVYIAASLGWLWMIEGQASTRWDLAGASLCLVGVTVILLGESIQR